MTDSPTLADAPGRTSYDVFSTPLGWVAVVASGAGVRQTSLPEPSAALAMDAVASALEGAVHDPVAVTGIAASVVSYCSGQPVDLTALPLDMHGRPEFFRRAWDACQSIPAGQTRTYAWLAAAAGRPGAARGAGQAMARNPVPLLVPCHRVVGSDGGLHGFGGSTGLPLKQRLLDMESRWAAPLAKVHVSAESVAAR